MKNIIEEHYLNIVQIGIYYNINSFLIHLDDPETEIQDNVFNTLQNFVIIDKDVAKKVINESILNLLFRQKSQQ